MSRKKKKEKILESFLIEHELYPNMFYVKFDDGTKSLDFYNKTRAVEHYFSSFLQESEKTDPPPILK